MDEKIYQLVHRDGTNYWIGSQGLSIGRSRSNHVVIADRRVSRRHAVLWSADGRCWIRDEHSALGTLINGQPASGMRELCLGDIVQVGNETFRVQGSAGMNYPAKTGRIALPPIAVIAMVTIGLVLLFVMASGRLSSHNNPVGSVSNLNSSGNSTAFLPISQSIGPQGGEIRLSNGAKVIVPQGAVEGNGVLSIQPRALQESDPPMVGPIYQIELANGRLVQPIQLSFPVPAGASGSKKDPVIGHYDDTRPVYTDPISGFEIPAQWLPLPTEEQNGVLTAWIDSFSDMGIFDQGACEAFDDFNAESTPYLSGNEYYEPGQPYRISISGNLHLHSKGVFGAWDSLTPGTSYTVTLMQDGLFKDTELKRWPNQQIWTTEQYQDQVEHYGGPDLNPSIAFIGENIYLQERQVKLFAVVDAFCQKFPTNTITVKQYEPEINFYPKQALPGDAIDYYGSGFPPNQEVQIIWGDLSAYTELDRAKVGENRRYSGLFTIPEEAAPYDNFKVEAVSADKKLIATGYIEWLKSAPQKQIVVSVDPVSGKQGDSFTIKIGGLPRGKTALVNVYGPDNSAAQVYSATTSPADWPGVGYTTIGETASWAPGNYSVKAAITDDPSLSAQTKFILDPGDNLDCLRITPPDGNLIEDIVMAPGETKNLRYQVEDVCKRFPPDKWELVNYNPRLVQVSFNKDQMQLQAVIVADALDSGPNWVVFGLHYPGHTFPTLVAMQVQVSDQSTPSASIVAVDTSVFRSEIANLNSSLQVFWKIVPFSSSLIYLDAERMESIDLSTYPADTYQVVLKAESTANDGTVISREISNTVLVVIKSGGGGSPVPPENGNHNGNANANANNNGNGNGNSNANTNSNGNGNSNGNANTNGNDNNNPPLPASQCTWSSTIIGEWAHQYPDRTVFLIYETGGTGIHSVTGPNIPPYNLYRFQWQCLQNDQLSYADGEGPFDVTIVDYNHLRIGGDIWQRVDPNGPLAKVPNVIGKTREEATKILEDAGFHVQIGPDGYSDQVPQGTIYMQKPGAGELAVPANTWVEIFRNLKGGTPQPASCDWMASVIQPTTAEGYSDWFDAWDKDRNEPYSTPLTAPYEPWYSGGYWWQIIKFKEDHTFTIDWGKVQEVVDVEYSGNWTCYPESGEQQLKLTFTGSHRGERTFRVRVAPPWTFPQFRDNLYILEMVDLHSGEIYYFDWSAW